MKRMLLPIATDINFVICMSSINLYFDFVDDTTNTFRSPDFQMSLFGDLLNTFPTLSQQLGFLDPLARFSELVMEKLLVFENGWSVLSSI